MSENTNVISGMKVNYHTHTTRCHHATGADREYVEAAIRAGLSVLGFSDHSPYYFPNGYYSGHRMFPTDIEGYITSLLSMKKEYEKDITIFIGFEAEYYPKYFDKTLELLSPYPYDYLILGQHFAQNEIGEQDVFHGGGEEMLARYVDVCIEGIGRGVFFYLAHPDVFHFVGDAASYERQMRRLCLAALEKHIPLEINLLGIRAKRNYPNELFWKIAGETGNEVIFGCDSHDPESLAKKSGLWMAENLIHKYQLKRIEPMTPFIPAKPDAAGHSRSI